MRTCRRRLFAWTTCCTLSLACTPSTERAESASAVDSLDARLATLEDRDETTVDLLPGSGTYEVLRIDLGALAVSLDAIEATPNGSRIRLRIGNVTTATIEDLDATVYWGPIDADSIPVVSQARSKDVSMPGKYRPGAWTPVTFALEGVTPSSIGFLRLAEASHRGLELRPQ
jgi:uncharacterized protein DUF3251